MAQSGLTWDDAVNIASSPNTLQSIQDGGRTILNFARNGVVIMGNDGLINTVIGASKFNSTIQSIVSRLP